MAKPKVILFNNKEYRCPVEVVIALIHGKWKSEIMWLIKKEPKRFCEIKQLLYGISAKVLTEQLRELEGDGMIKREVYSEIHSHVEYSLSQTGLSIWPILEQMYNWGVNYLKLAEPDASIVKNRVRPLKLHISDRLICRTSDPI